MLVDVDLSTQPEAHLMERLESGDIVCFSSCPFSLPTTQQREFLYRQQLHPFHKNITLNPMTGKVTGSCRQSPADSEMLKQLLTDFGNVSLDWLARLLPQYAQCWKRDRVSFRPEEEATRSLRPHARNDLLHIDSFPTRPTHGDRLLRIFVNIHQTDPRVWVTSDTFDVLLERFGQQVNGRIGTCWHEILGRSLSSMLGQPCDSEYDRFMLRFHHFLKSNEQYQERCRKRFWHFAPFSVWVSFTDALSHAVLRGRYALEQSVFVPVSAMKHPEHAPISLLKSNNSIVLHKAA